MEDTCQRLQASGIGDYDIVKTVEIAAALISALISLLFLISAVVLKFYREFLFKISMGIIASGLFFSLVPFVRDYMPSPTDTTCGNFGLVQVYLTFSSLCWCTSFAHGAYLVAKGGSPRNIERWFWVYLTTALLLPLALVAPFMWTSGLSCYVDLASYCSINYQGISLEVLLVTGVAWLSALICTVLYYQWIRREMIECGLPIKYRVYVLPATSLLCWVPVLVGYYRAYRSESSPPLWFILTQTSCFYLYGFLNVVAYGCCKRARLEFLKRCLKRKSIEPAAEKSHLVMSDSMLPESRTVDSIGRVAYFSYNRTVCLSTLRDSFI